MNVANEFWKLWKLIFFHLLVICPLITIAVWYSENNRYEKYLKENPEWADAVKQRNLDEKKCRDNLNRDEQFLCYLDLVRRDDKVYEYYSFKREPKLIDPIGELINVYIISFLVLLATYLIFRNLRWAYKKGRDKE